MAVLFAESFVSYQPPAWWQRALIADGQSWIWLGTLIISLALIFILALRYMYFLWWLYRIRHLRGQGLITSSELRVGQCAYLQLLEGDEEKRMRRWRTMVRRIHPDTVDVDLPACYSVSKQFASGARVALAVNAADSLYVMETEVLDIASGEPGILRLRRQPLLHRLQRRQFARVEVFAPATVEVVGGKSIGRYAGVVLDIGGGGMCLQLPVAPLTGSIVRLEAPSLSDVLPQSVRLTVMGVSESVVDGRVEYHLHCAFTGLDAEHLERVARFVLQKQYETRVQYRWRASQSADAQHVR